MTVKSTHSLWQQPEPALTPPFPDRVDVCILGAGIAGLSVAYHLARAGKMVAVLERGEIGAGMTSCTSAHLASMPDRGLANIERTRGKEAAALAVRACATAIDTIEEIAAREKIDCDFRRVDGYLFGRPQHQRLLAEEEAACRRAGLAVERVPHAPLVGFDTGPCLRVLNQAQFEPMAYLIGLADAVRRHGGLILTNTPAKRVLTSEPGGVETNNGRFVRSSAVVVATNSPVNNTVALHTKQAPYMTYLVAFRIEPGSIHQALYWDTEDPFHYVRVVPDRQDSKHEWLLVGGEDHKTGQASNQEERFAQLEAWARAHFLVNGSAERRWAGQVLETMDGLAFIGHNPGDDLNVYVVSGDSGMGLTHGTIAGLLLDGLIREGSHVWAGLFDPGRLPATGLGDFLSENINAAWQYTSYLTGGDVQSAAQIAPGQGAVVRSGLKKLAMYRDEAGELHTCSAVCPHLGAVVQWNQAEQTWDCPVHGSRFDCQGKVVQGPANSDLKPVEQPAAL